MTNKRETSVSFLFGICDQTLLMPAVLRLD